MIFIKFIFYFRFFDEVNSEFTDYIKRSVRGVAPDVTNEVLDSKFFLLLYNNSLLDVNVQSTCKCILGCFIQTMK